MGADRRVPVRATAVQAPASARRPMRAARQAPDAPKRAKRRQAARRDRPCAAFPARCAGFRPSSAANRLRSPDSHAIMSARMGVYWFG